MKRALAVLFFSALLLSGAGPALAQVSGGFSCVISGATADAVCQAAPGAGQRFYVTGVVVSNAGTAQTVRIVTGTGTACGTSADVVVPLLNMPINGTVSLAFKTPVQTSVNEDLCSDISGTTAHSVQIVGLIAP